MRLSNSNLKRFLNKSKKRKNRFEKMILRLIFKSFQQQNGIELLILNMKILESRMLILFSLDTLTLESQHYLEEFLSIWNLLIKFNTRNYNKKQKLFIDQDGNFLLLPVIFKPKKIEEKQLNVLKLCLLSQTEDIHYLMLQDIQIMFQIWLWEHVKLI